MTAPGFTAHVSIPIPLALAAEALFFVGVGAGMGAWWYAKRPASAGRRIVVVGLGIVAGACLVLVSVLPFAIGPGALSRPASTARLTIVTPAQGQRFAGDPAEVPVALDLEGGRIVPATTVALVPDEGHIHLYVDDRLVAMTGLTGVITATAGMHTLRAEFAARDHGPFDPRVVTSVTFEVDPLG